MPTIHRGGMMVGTPWPRFARRGYAHLATGYTVTPSRLACAETMRQPCSVRSSVLAELISHAGFLAGVVNVVTGDYLSRGSGPYRINDAAKRGTMEVVDLPRQSEYPAFENQEKGRHYRSPVKLLPETVEFARGLAVKFEAAKLAPSEIAAMRLLAAGGVSEYQGEGWFSTGSGWKAIDDPKISVTSKAMRPFASAATSTDGRRRQAATIAATTFSAPPASLAWRKSTRLIRAREPRPHKAFLAIPPLRKWRFNNSEKSYRSGEVTGAVVVWAAIVTA
jgi:hypothetical protein